MKFLKSQVNRSLRNEGLGSIDIAKSLSHAAAVLAGHEDDWEWEWEDE